MNFAKLACTAFFASLMTACAVSPPDNTTSYRPGTGVVQEVRVARVSLPDQQSGGAIAGSEAARGSYGSPVERIFRPRWTEGYQLTLRMDDGSTQAITQDSPDFKAGDRVQITPEGRVLKSAPVATPAPTSPVPGITPTPAPRATPGASPSAYRPGLGTVESASVVSLSSSSSAAAGGTGATMAYRVRMADGSTQNVVQAGERFSVGERAQVTSDGRLVRP